MKTYAIGSAGSISEDPSPAHLQAESATACHRVMRLIRVSFHLLIVFLSSVVNAESEQPAELDRYLARVKEVETDAYDYAREHGKVVLLSRYQRLLDEYPGFPKEVYLRSRIALIYEWNLRERNEPPDIPKALEVYDAIIKESPTDAPYLKEVLFLAGDRNSRVAPERSVELYNRLLKDYPDDDSTKLECYLRLGVLALSQGKRDEAEELFSTVLLYDPVSSIPRMN